MHARNKVYKVSLSYQSCTMAQTKGASRSGPNPDVVRGANRAPHRVRREGEATCLWWSGKRTRGADREMGAPQSATSSNVNPMAAYRYEVRERVSSTIWRPFHLAWLLQPRDLSKSSEVVQE